MADLEQMFSALQKADAAGNVEDAREIAAMIRQFQSQPQESQGITSVAGDLGKLFGAGAVGSVAGAPEAVQASASGMARETTFGPTEALNLLAQPQALTNKLVGAIGLPPVFKEQEKLIPESVVKEQKAELDKALTQGKIQSLQKITEAGGDLAKRIEASISPEMKAAMAASQPTGNIIEALDTGDFSKISMGTDPSLLGLSGQFAKVFGSTAPIIATSLLTKKVAPAAITGFGQAASEGVQDARDHIRNMSDAELSKNSEYFRNLIVLGYDPKTARTMTEDKAADTAALYQGTVGALGGAFTGSLVTGKLDKALLSGARNKATRILQGATVGATEEGLQELAEGLATDLAIDKTVARQMGADSFANAVLGAIGGGGPGGVRGAVAPSAQVTAAPEVSAPAPAAPVAAPPSAAQDTAAMIAELEKLSKPAAPIEASPAVAPEATTVAPAAAPAEAPQAPQIQPVSPATEIKAELKDLYKQRNQLAKVGDNLVPWLKKYGIKPSEKADMGIEKGDRRIPVGIFKSKGYGLDELARAAVNDGIITEADLAEGVGGVESFRNLVYDALQGNVSRTPVNMENMAKLDAITSRIEQLESPDYQLAAETQAESEARLQEEAAARKAEEDAAIDAEMARKAEESRAEIARRSQQAAQDFALGQTAEENLAGQQRLDDDIPFFSMERPNERPYTRQIANAERVLNEKLDELKSLNTSRTAIKNRFETDRMKPTDQMIAAQLRKRAKILEDEIDTLKWETRNNSAEKFVARAAKALSDNELDKDVVDVIYDIYKKEPNLLEGLKLRVIQGTPPSDVQSFQAAGEFVGRIVKLYKDTSGVEDPSVVRHELTHSLEQVMSKDAKKKLVQQWRNALDKAQAKERTAEGKAFFKALLGHLNNPTKDSFTQVSQMMPVGKKDYYYQFMSPSEYWAVNAEKLLKAQLGGAWEKFKKFVNRLYQSLKDLFGFDNTNLIHKTFEQVLKGKREGITMLTDLQRGVVPTRAIEQRPSVGKAPELTLRSDIPSQRWVQEKRDISNEYGKKSSGAPKVFGSVTGTFPRSVMLPVSVLEKIKGVNSEQQNIRKDDLAAIKDIMSRTGKLPQNQYGEDYHPFITVAQDGTPYVSEGNHRIMAAKELGFKYLPVEVRYFNGAELESGILNPDKVKKYDADAYGSGNTLESYSPPSATMAMEPVKPRGPRNIENQVVSPVWNSPETTKADDLIYKLQDKNIDTKRVIQAIEKEAGKLEDQWNVYQKEELYHGRTSAALRKFLLQDLMPIIKQMSKMGISPADMKAYLHNRHAKERNDQIAKIRPAVLPDGSPNPAAMTDGGSGLTYKQIDDYFASLDPAKAKKLEEVAKKFDEMVKGTQKILVDSGAETQETIDAWNKTYKHYVPLFREDEDFATHPSQGTGKGFSSSGATSKRAMGSTKGVQDILGNILAQRERALIKAEKIRVGRALYGLAIKNPNPQFWLPVNPDAIKDLSALAAELDSLGLDGADVAGMMKEIKKPELVRDRKTGLQTVRYKINPLERYKDNVFPVRVNGKDRYIFFNQNDPRAKRMVEAMKNLDTEQLGAVLGMFGKFTRWFSAVNTQYNPVFGGINLLRDVQGAAINLSTTKIAGEQRKVLADVIPSMRTIFRTLRAEQAGRDIPDTDDAKLWEQFKQDGGQTLYRDSLTRKAEEKQLIEHELERMKRSPFRKSFGAAVQLLSDFNDTIENAVRFSAYKVAITPKDKGGAGLSREQAASIAKNLTVNFDRKGQLGSRINALYAFFNAAVQGSARLYETMKGPAGRKILAGGIALGTIQAVALALAGFDEDEPPEFIKERNLIIPLGDKKYAMIPMPLGLHFFPNIGRIATEWAINDFKNPGKHLANLFGTAMDAFNPLGSSGLSMQTLAPSIADPFLALEANKDAFGRPIYKKDQATNPTPGYLRSREGATEISKMIAEFLNYASGGTKYQKGTLFGPFSSPTGDEIDYLVGQFTGGVGREIMKVQSAIESSVTGEELPPYRVPIAGRFIGDAESKAADAQRFYENVTKMANFENEIKGRAKNRENVAEFMRENPQARLWQVANTAENQISQLNKTRKELLAKGAPKERIQQIENQKQVIMRRFNNQVKALEP